MIETIITALVGALSGGSLTALFTLKQNKRALEIDNEIHLVSEYKELLEQYKSEREAMLQEREEEKRKFQELTQKYTEVQVQLSLMQKMYEQASLLKCENVNCQQRRPPIEKDALNELVGLNEEKNAGHKTTVTTDNA